MLIYEQENSSNNDDLASESSLQEDISQQNKEESNNKKQALWMPTQRRNNALVLYIDEDPSDDSLDEGQKYLQLSEKIVLSKDNFRKANSLYKFYLRLFAFLWTFYVILIALEIAVGIVDGNFRLPDSDATNNTIFGIIVFGIAILFGPTNYLLLYLKTHKDPGCLLSSYQAAFNYLKERKDESFKLLHSSKCIAQRIPNSFANHHRKSIDGKFMNLENLPSVKFLNNTFYKLVSTKFSVLFVLSIMTASILITAPLISLLVNLNG